MQEFVKTYEKWRKMLLHTNQSLVVFIFIVEFFVSFVLKESDLMLQSTIVYLMNFLIVPTALNLLILFAGRTARKHVASDSGISNYIPSIQLSLICMVVACTHFVFSSTLCIFCIPPFTTVIFGDKKITRRVGMICGAALTGALLCRRFSGYRLPSDPYFWTEAIIAFAVLSASIAVCSVLIKFQQEKNDTIQRGYLLNLEMKEQLSRDQKTGLYGNAVFMNTLAEIVKTSEATGNMIAVAFIDIDDFKRINDSQGHLRGDQVILKLAELMQQNNSGNQFMARFGGEEFAIIFRDEKTVSAFDFLENLRIKFSELKYTFVQDTITISIGLAVWKSGCTSEELFDHADMAMYASKAAGKNRTTIYAHDLTADTIG